MEIHHRKVNGGTSFLFLIASSLTSISTWTRSLCSSSISILLSSLAPEQPLRVSVLFSFLRTLSHNQIYKRGLALGFLTLVSDVDGREIPIAALRTFIMRGGTIT